VAALSGHADPVGSCPLSGSQLNRSTQHFIVEKKIDYRPINQRFRGGTRAAEKITLWDSWLRRDSLKAIGRAFWHAVIVIYCQLAPSVASTG
jgi:hypothetical protein